MARRIALSEVAGFIAQPLTTATGEPYTGRLTLQDVQVAEAKDHPVVTHTVTARELFDAAQARMLWTDQTIQRGVKPDAPVATPTKLALADGYPDPQRYVFNAEQANDIAEKLLEGAELYLEPIFWNLRPGTFKAFHDEVGRRVFIYSGEIFIPDSHHRHQGLLKAARVYQEAPGEYPRFSLDAQFSINLLFLAYEQEGEFYYQKNMLGTVTARSRGYELTTEDPLAILARTVIDHSASLTQNVNRVTDRLTDRNPQVMTLSTLRGLLETAVASAHLTSEELQELAPRVASFFELLVEVRPELGQLPVNDRKKVRRTLVIDQAVMLHGFALPLRRFLTEAEKHGLEHAVSVWRQHLAVLGEGVDYDDTDEHGTVLWSGDFFSRSNPLWRREGVIQPTKSGGDTISNTRQTRANCGKALLARLHRVNP